MTGQIKWKNNNAEWKKRIFLDKNDPHWGYILILLYEASWDTFSLLSQCILRNSSCLITFVHL